MKNFTVVDHPLIQHKLTIIRDKDCSTNQFRQCVTEIARLMTYEATRDFPLEDVSVTTPMGTATEKKLGGKKPVVVPILRAGMGMLDGVLDMLPSARVGFIGMQRDEETLIPEEYYAKFPKKLGDRQIIIIDPMLATGGSAMMAVEALKKRGAKRIKFLSLVAAPEGVNKLMAAHPDIELYTAALDDHLNEIGYIVPGLGDAGDRLYGTVDVN